MKYIKYKNHILGFSLFMILISIYIITYQGMPIVIDEALIFDSTESLVQRGHTSMNYDFYRQAETRVDVCAVDGGDPWQSAKYEFIIYALLTPLATLAFSIAGAGNFHIIMFFNIFITALTAVSIYGLALKRGYSSKAAWVSGLLFALATIAWFYGRQLYREPLAGLFLLWSFGLASLFPVYWNQEKRSLRWVVLLIIATLGFMATKVVLVVLLPGTLIIMSPIFTRWIRYLGLYRLVILVIVGLGLIAGLLLALERELFGYGDYYDISELLSRITDVFQDGFSFEALLGYQIGPSRSLWLYSPALILGLYGMVLLWRQKEYFIVISLAGCILGFSFFYGWLYTANWIGSWGWGPRYLLPLIPAIVLLWVVPAVEQLLQSPRGIGLIIAVGAVGAMLQLVGMAVPLSNYYTDVFRAGEYHDYADLTTYVRHWMGANWSLEWMPAYYHLTHIDLNHLNVAWQGIDSAAVIPIALAVSSFILSLWMSKRSFQERPLHSYAGVILAMLIIGLAFLALVSTVYVLRDDRRYIAPEDWTDVRTLVKELNNAVEDDSIVFIDREQYKLVFMNYYKEAVPAVVLPYAPAEFGVEATLDDPIGVQIGTSTVCALDWGGEQYERLWLVASAGPFMTEYLRPIERHLVNRYFPINQIEVTQRARAIQFLTIPAPASNEPSVALDVILDNQIKLVGMDLPAGDRFKAGKAVPLSLVWEPMTTLAHNYNVGVYLLDEAGFLRSQRDGSPQGTFGNMSLWQPGEQYRDNHGLEIPEDLPPGNYMLATSVYRWEDGYALPITDGEGSILQLATIQVLP